MLALDLFLMMLIFFTLLGISFHLTAQGFFFLMHSVYHSLYCINVNYYYYYF